MKGNRMFIIIITVMIIVLFMLQLQMPKQFSWTPTFGHDDRDPFGCYVVDSVLSQTMPKGYRVNSKTLYQLSHEEGRQGVLIVTDNLNLKELDYISIKKILKHGGTVMIVGEENYYGDLDTTMVKNFGFCLSGNNETFDLASLKESIKTFSPATKDTIDWNGLFYIFGERNYPVYGSLMTSRVRMDKVRDVDLLAYYNKEVSYADSQETTETWHNQPSLLVAGRTIGRGKVILAACPLVFTNYGMLTGNTAEYIHRLMSLMQDVPVTRTETYMETPQMAESQQSPFRYFLSQPSLMWALYLSLLTVLIFMIFTARRRQRVIPVMKEPENKSLEFVQLIGTLYYQKHDNTDLVRKKFVYFAEELRRRLMIDVADTNDNDHTFTVLSRNTGMAYEEVATIIKNLRLAYYYEGKISSGEMRKYIDQMNEIIRKI